MNLRLPPTRIALAAAALVLALVAFRLFTNGFRADDALGEGVTDALSLPAFDQQPGNPAAAAVGGRTLTLDDLGAPDDPLPDPLPLPAIAEPAGSSQAVETLARQVLEGGPESFPALIAALQASGIGVIGSDRSEVVKPAEPWQGIAMQRWEVRLAAAMVLPDRTVSLALSDLAAVLVAVAPQLNGAPIEQLIVQDIRALAESESPTRRFFGRFIVALGRNAVGHDPYDLLGTADPQTIRFDGLQTSLILRRLATDILTATADGQKAGKTASLIDAIGGWVVSPVHAQGQPPCVLSDRAQSNMDIAAFGSSMAWGGFAVGEMGMPGVMQRLGLDKLSNVAAIASTLLGYAQFIATYAALEAEVTMDAPPLVRTKKTSPGERRELTAIVKMNVGNAQMLNCLRAILIAVGLDFSLPNHGPVKGAHVRWYGVEGFDVSAAALHGGPEAIVELVTSSGQSITDAVTGEDGKVQVGVEGRPQRQRMSDQANEVHKSAKVRLHVALKGADLFGDLQEAAGTAAGGLVGLVSLPLSVLYRAQWASVGHYRFPVTDWRDGPAQWSGTISEVETTISGYTSDPTHTQGAHTTQETETRQLTIAVTDTNDEQSGGGVYWLKGNAEGRYSRQKTFAGWTLRSCGSVSSRQMKNTSRESSAGSGEGEATLMVSVADDGSYQISASTPDLRIPIEGRFDGEIETFGYACAVQMKGDSRTDAPSEWSAGGTIGVSGKVDPRNPDVLSGSISEELPQATPQPGSTYKRVKTTTWQLRRD